MRTPQRLSSDENTGRKDTDDHTQIKLYSKQFKFDRSEIDEAMCKRGVFFGLVGRAESSFRDRLV